MISPIIRSLYLNKIKPFIGKSLIKVLIGQRGVGKSYLLKQIKEEILKEKSGIQWLYINKESLEFDFIKTAKDLHQYIQENVDLSKETALFINEIQDIQDFEQVLRDYCSRDSIDMYITGSNARLLSGELATYLTGRYIEFKIFSLSYAEFIQFYQLEDSYSTFTNYLKKGGLPYLIHLPDEVEVIREYHKNIYNSIILKDVVARFNVRNVAFLESLTHFLALNVGSLVSAKKISDYLNSQKMNMSTQLVLDYLNYLEAAQFIFCIKRMDIKGKKVFEIGEKYYFEDIGIRNSIVGYSIQDIHKLLENCVLHHLKISGYSVFIGNDDKKEIDFVAEKNGERLYIQVAYLLQDEQTIEREYGNLLAIPDNYPKYVVTMDTSEETGTYLGIKRMHLKDFCLMITSTN